MELNFKLIEDAIPLLLAGAGITLEITAMSVGFGLLIGMIIGVATVSYTHLTLPTNSLV